MQFQESSGFGTILGDIGKFFEHSVSELFDTAGDVIHYGGKLIGDIIESPVGRVAVITLTTAFAPQIAGAIFSGGGLVSTIGKTATVLAITTGTKEAIKQHLKKKLKKKLNPGDLVLVLDYPMFLYLTEIRKDLIGKYSQFVDNVEQDEVGRVYITLKNLKDEVIKELSKDLEILYTEILNGYRNNYSYFIDKRLYEYIQNHRQDLINKWKYALYVLGEKDGGIVVSVPSFLKEAFENDLKKVRSEYEEFIKRAGYTVIAIPKEIQVDIPFSEKLYETEHSVVVKIPVSFYNEIMEIVDKVIDKEYKGFKEVKNMKYITLTKDFVNFVSRYFPNYYNYYASIAQVVNETPDTITIAIPDDVFPRFVQDYRYLREQYKRISGIVFTGLSSQMLIGIGLGIIGLILLLRKDKNVSG